MKKQEKVEYTNKLKVELEKAKSVVLVNYAGLGVKAQQDLKKKLKVTGARMLVVKNTLLKRAGVEVKIDPEVLTDTILSGQTALILADSDPVAPIQVLGKFAKEFEVPKFKIGVVEGLLQDEAGLIKLSTLPGKDALLGQLLGTLLSPSYGLVGTLNGNLQKLVYILSEKAKS